MFWRNSNLSSPLTVVLAFVLILGMSVSAFAEDPGQPDSIVIGNLDGSLLYADINEQLVVPIWVKTDDSVTFMHIPISSDDEYFESRDGGVLYPPVIYWDDIRFLDPQDDPFNSGYSSQSLFGNAYISNPRDPQNFLYTNYQWVHIADFHIQVINDPAIYGDTTCLIAGFSQFYGWMLFRLQDGNTQFVPQMVFSCVTFLDNIPPVIIEPEDGLTYEVNHYFPFSVDVTASDGDETMLDLTVDFDADNYQFLTIQSIPGYIHKRFSWTAQDDHVGTFTAVFSVDDGNGGIDQHTMTFESSPVGLNIPEINAMLDMTIDIPINLINNGVSSYIGGFEIFVRYDSPMICLTSVTRAQRLADWDYYHVHYEDTSGIRIVGLADVTGNGTQLEPGEGPIAWIHGYISNDEQYEGEFAWIRFITNDYNDNTITDSTGYSLIHPTLDDGWIHALAPEDIVIGDINLNGFTWEISDAVVLANFLVDPEEYPLDPIQMVASNTNGDGQQGTVADLVFLLHVISGDIPPPRVNYGLDMSAFITIEDSYFSDNRYSVGYQSDIPSGGILIRIDHTGAEIGEVIPVTDLDMQIVDKNGVLSVLIFDMDGKYINPDSRLFDLEIESGKFDPSFKTLQVSDRFGYQVPVEGKVEIGLPDMFRLYGAYPNPFNASTNISFTLPAESDVELTVFNILGQEVKSLEIANMPAGEGNINWDGRSSGGEQVASGVYLYRITAGDFSASSRMVLLK